MAIYVFVLEYIPNDAFMESLLAVEILLTPIM
jgi:hypothetical protein